MPITDTSTSLSVINKKTPQVDETCGVKNINNLRHRLIVCATINK